MCVLRAHVLAAVSVPIGAHMLALALVHDHLYGTLQRTYGMLIIAFTLIQVSSSLAHSTFALPPCFVPALSPPRHRNPPVALRLSTARTLSWYM